MNRDLKYERLHSPRTLSEAFGPYAKLHVDPEKTPLRAYVWMVGSGIVVGIVWYAVVFIAS